MIEDGVDIFYEFIKEIMDGKDCYTPETWKKCVVRLKDGYRINRRETDLEITNGEKSYIVMLEPLYKLYLRKELDIPEILKVIKYSIANKLGKGRLETLMEDMEAFKASIRPVLINTRANKEFLSDVPNREFCDLSIIYRVLYNNSGEVKGSSQIDNNVMNRLGLIEEELYEIAMSNMTDYKFNSLQENLESVGIKADSEVFDEGISEYALYNSSYLYGAAYIAKKGVLKEIAEKLCDDLYIIPSSMHEVIINPCSKVGDVDGLAKIIYATNIGTVNCEDRLSDNLYKYNRETDEVSVAVEAVEHSL